MAAFNRHSACNSGIAEIATTEMRLSTQSAAPKSPAETESGEQGKVELTDEYTAQFLGI